MNNSGLHISLVAFDWPWPPNYGGVIDIYYKIQGLLNAGVKVDLHVISKHPKPKEKSDLLLNPLLKVYQYKRSNWQALFTSIPYIVSSRKVGLLLKNLLKGPATILFEGIHTTAYVETLKAAGKRVFLRMHNIEKEYYDTLALQSESIGRKLFFNLEAKKLDQFEANVWKTVDGIFSISEVDVPVVYPFNNRVVAVPPFTEHNQVCAQEGKGKYALIHAGLHVEDNARTALEIATKWNACVLESKLIVAGKNPPQWLTEAINGFSNVELIPSPSVLEMNQLIQKAQLIILKSNHKAGVKLKLINSLFLGRHVIANQAMVYGAPTLKKLVHDLVDEQWEMTVKELMQKPFSNQEMIKRKTILKEFQQSEATAVLLKQLMF